MNEKCRSRSSCFLFLVFCFLRFFFSLSPFETEWTVLSKCRATHWIRMVYFCVWDDNIHKTSSCRNSNWILLIISQAHVLYTSSSSETSRIRCDSFYLYVNVDHCSLLISYKRYEYEEMKYFTSRVFKQKYMWSDRCCSFILLVFSCHFYSNRLCEVYQFDYY